MDPLIELSCSSMEFTKEKNTLPRFDFPLIYYVCGILKMR